MLLKAKSWVIFSDGASRGNPGPSAIGGVIYDVDGVEVHQISQRIGFGTNNEAEYRSAIAGMEAALALGAKQALLRMDSELVVRQLKGVYKVRNPRLKPLYDKLRALTLRLGSFQVEWVPRKANQVADSLANRALDGSPPS